MFFNKKNLINVILGKLDSLHPILKKWYSAPKFAKFNKCFIFLIIKKKNHNSFFRVNYTNTLSLEKLDSLHPILRNDTTFLNL